MEHLFIYFTVYIYIEDSGQTITLEIIKSAVEINQNYNKQSILSPRWAPIKFS